jgi:PLP dependent protein
VSLEAVRRRIDEAARRSGRDPGDITLVVVSKGRTEAEITSIYRQGHRDFGENRAAALAEKAGRLPADITWHFVGPLQTNKVRMVRPVADLLHSLDRERLAAAWVKGPGRPPPVLIEANIGGEAQKGGAAPERAGDLIRAAVDLGLEVRGLMAIPPQTPDAEGARPYFRRLAEMRDELGMITPLPVLSMGMSDDFEVAVEEGATVVRLGRAIFSSSGDDRIT